MSKFNVEPDYFEPLAGIKDLEKLQELGKPSGRLVYSPLMGMPDQEIRARALECAVDCGGSLMFSDDETVKSFWVLVETFEAYIRDGNAG